MQYDISRQCGRCHTDPLPLPPPTTTPDRMDEAALRPLELADPMKIIQIP
jgi:hypothetical protein